jgi:hypothetical protein
LARDGQNVGRRHRLTADAVFEPVAFDELHDERGRSGGVLDAEDGRDVAMVERGDTVSLVYSQLPGWGRSFIIGP